MKVIVITGASRGIGRACALALAQKNTHLVLIGQESAQNLSWVTKKCTERGATVQPVAINLSNTEDIENKITQVKRELGHIDALINNAGIWHEAPFEKGDLDFWDNALDVNLKGAIHMTRHCLGAMHEGSAVIFIASIASRKTYAGGTNYCAAKFGLLGFAGSLFEDIREKGIKVCSILPGVVNTDMHKDDPKLEESKMIQPEDVAQTVAFVLSMPGNVCPTEITLMPQKNPKTR